MWPVLTLSASPKKPHGEKIIGVMTMVSKFLRCLDLRLVHHHLSTSLVIGSVLLIELSVNRDEVYCVPDLQSHKSKILYRYNYPSIGQTIMGSLLTRTQQSGLDNIKGDSEIWLGKLPNRAYSKLLGHIVIIGSRSTLD